MAHRWNADKVCKWESKLAQWNLSRPDGLEDFLATLPPPRSSSQDMVKNAKGGDALLWNFIYEDVPENQLQYHGTTYLGLRDILENGLRASSDAAIHEFTTPGIYTADKWECSLYYHATATRFASASCPHDLPYVRFLLLVQPLAAPKKSSSYGAGRQFMYNEGQLRVCQLLVCRGWNFVDSGEKVLHTESQPSHHTSVQEPSSGPPPPPPLETKERVAASSRTDPWAWNSTLVATLLDQAAPRHVEPWVWNSSNDSQAATRHVQPWVWNRAPPHGVEPPAPPPPPLPSAASQPALVPWKPGDPWRNGIAFECVVCGEVKEQGKFSKRNQAYSCTRRVCRTCA